MKYALGLLSLAFLLPPAAALADDSPSPAPAPPGVSAPAGSAGQRGFSDRRHDLRANREQVRKIMFRTRSQILGALTPEHRALLARVVGQLAIAPNPDPEAAAKQLDAALSPGESTAVVAAAESAHQQMRDLMQGMHRGPGPDGDRGPGAMNGPAPGGPGGMNQTGPETMNGPGPGGPGAMNGPGQGGPEAMNGPGGRGDDRWQHKGRHHAPDAGHILLMLARLGPPPGPGPR
jgi:hypothetical protein